MFPTECRKLRDTMFMSTPWKLCEMCQQLEAIQPLADFSTLSLSEEGLRTNIYVRLRANLTSDLEKMKSTGPITTDSSILAAELDAMLEKLSIVDGSVVDAYSTTPRELSATLRDSGPMLISVEAPYAIFVGERDNSGPCVVYHHHDNLDYIAV